MKLEIKADTWIKESGDIQVGILIKNPFELSAFTFIPMPAENATIPQAQLVADFLQANSIGLLGLLMKYKAQEILNSIP